MATNKDSSKNDIFGSDELPVELGVRSGYPCSPCESNSRYRKAIKYCQNCEEYFCSECLHQHSQFRLMRNHVVIEAFGNGNETEPDLRTVKGDLPKCTIHISNFVTKYCYQHKEVCCELCAAFKHRTCRDKTDINDAANKVKKSVEYKRQDECLAGMASSLESLTSDIRRQLEQLDIVEEQSLRNVENYREELIATVNKQADESRRRIEMFYSERKSRKQSDMTKLDLAVTSVNETLKELRSENNIRALICLRSCACLLQEYKDFLEVASSTEQRQQGFNIDMSLLKGLSSHQCYFYEESLSTSATTSGTSGSPVTGFIFTTSATVSQLPASTSAATTTYGKGFVFGGALKGASGTASIFGGKPAVSSTVGEKTDGDKLASTGDSLFSWKPATFTFGGTSAKAADSATPESAEADKDSVYEMFNPKSDSWTCDGCSAQNDEGVLKCPCCSTLKAGIKKEDQSDPRSTPLTFCTQSRTSLGFKFCNQPFQSSSTSTSTGFKLESTTADSRAAAGAGFKFYNFGSWKCNGCCVQHEMGVLICPFCSKLKPGVKKEDQSATRSTAFTFGIPSGASSELKFGIQSSHSSSTITAAVSQSGAAVGFKFDTGTEKPRDATLSGFRLSTSANTSGAKHQDKTNTASSAAGTPQKTVFQGFSFTSSPKVSQPKLKMEPNDLKPVVTAIAAATKSFTGFSLTTAKPALSSMKVRTTVTQSRIGNQNSDSLLEFRTGSSQSFAGLTAYGQTASALQASGDGKGFFGTGTPVFARTPPSRRHDTSTGSDDHIEEYEPNVDFKPVTQLPELVEVKTGEEEEEKIFSERAKLFRFDSETNQWKERGIGDIKILRHQYTNVVRIFMQREQILKICANHKITKEMVLKQMSTSAKTWVWNAMDFSDGEMKSEKLAVKFKTVDSAVKFRKAFEK